MAQFFQGPIPFPLYQTQTPFNQMTPLQHLQAAIYYGSLGHPLAQPLAQIHANMINQVHPPQHTYRRPKT